jgi:hypothetical protein
MTFLKKFLLFGIFTFGSNCDLKKDMSNLIKFNVVIFEFTCDLPFATLISIVKIWSIVVKLRIDSNFPYKNFYTIYFSKFLRHSSALVFKDFYLSPNMNNKSSRISGKYCKRSTLTI